MLVFPHKSPAHPSYGWNSISSLYVINPAFLGNITARLTSYQNSCFSTAGLAVQQFQVGTRVISGPWEKHPARPCSPATLPLPAWGARCPAQGHSFPRLWRFLPAENRPLRVVGAGSLLQAAPVASSASANPAAHPFPCRALLCLSALALGPKEAGGSG